jgi:hypothetical protein
MQERLLALINNNFKKNDSVRGFFYVNIQTKYNDFDIYLISNMVIIIALT